MEEGRSALKILTGKPTGKRSLGTVRSRWEDNIRMNLKEICINTRNTIRLRIGTIESACKCGIQPPGSISHGVSVALKYLF